MTKQLTISMGEWEQMYRPLDAPYRMIDPDDESPSLRVALEVAHEQGKVWTWVDGAAWDYATLVSGVHRVNRLGYCITDRAVADGVEVFVMADRHLYVHIKAHSVGGRKEKSFRDALEKIVAVVQAEFPYNPVLTLSPHPKHPKQMFDIQVVDDPDIAYRLCDEIRESVKQGTNGANNLNSFQLMRLCRLIEKKLEL